jgi:site-specific recombinase XerD
MRFKEHALNEYRRHAPDCKLTQASEMNCTCPIWAVGRIHGKRFRKSLGTRNRQKARERINELLGQAPDTTTDEPAKASPTVSDAIRDYLGFCEFNKRLKGSTLRSYRKTLDAFAKFCERRLYRTVDQFSVRLFEDFQAERCESRDEVREVAIKPKTAGKEFQHLGGLCSRLVELGSIPTNYAQKVKLPKADGVSTMPFKEAEAKALLAACTRLGENKSPGGGYTLYSAERLDEERRYARALVLVLLTTGLRISDTVNLSRAKVFIDRKGHTRLRIRTEKTGVLVTLRLPHATVEALKNLVPASEELYFWKGGNDVQLEIACHRARRVIARLGAIAGVEDARPHRFRDTWAKEALLNGTSMRTVQLVLGHKSIRTTEEHYAPFVPEYQAMIDEATDAVASRLIA